MYNPPHPQHPHRLGLSAVVYVGMVYFISRHWRFEKEPGQSGAIPWGWETFAQGHGSG